MWANTLALAVFTLCAPIFGALSDKVGRKPILVGVYLSFLILGFPLFYLLNYSSLPFIFLIQIFFGLVSSAYYGVTFAICIEHLPTHVRYTGIALGYYISYAFFGGINGLYIVEFLSKKFTMDVSPVLYLLFGSLVALVSLLSIPEEAKT